MSDELASRLNDLKAAILKLGEVSSHFDNLSYRIVSLSVVTDRAIQAPTASKDTLALWKESVNSRGSRQLSSVEMRNLCWQPDAAFDGKFPMEHRKVRSDLLGRKEVMGLVYCQLARWSSILRGSIDVRLVNDWLNKSDRSGYFHSIKMYLDQKTGAEKFAKEMIRPNISVATELQKAFRIVTEGTEYARELRLHYGLANFNLMFGENITVRRWFHSEILGHLTKDLFVQILCKAVESCALPPSEDALNDFRILLVKFVDLGDPRIEGGQAKWKTVPEVIRNTVSEWFSQEDIRLFFDLFIDDDSDQQGRKQFWMKYALCVRRTRVLVGIDDLVKRARLAKEIRESSTIGKLLDNKASAFVMDFGSVLVVEFSRKNNACYLYAPESKTAVVQRFWSPMFKTSDLKNNMESWSLSHVGNRWQARLTYELALRGVRPK